MLNETILIVDDEEDILELVEYNLIKEGYRVITAATGEDALQIARDKLPDLILLDLMLPGVDGLEVCRILKADHLTSVIPIVMLTAKGSEADVVVGLEMGADDYITKPFSPRIITARTKAVLRRKRALNAEDENHPLQLSGMVINPERHEVLIEGQPINLTATEFSILYYIARRPGRVFTRDQIVDASRGKDYPVTDRSVDVHIVSSRKKLRSLGKCIETVRGVGYRYRD